MDEWTVARGAVLALILVGAASLAFRVVVLALIAVTEAIGPRLDHWAMTRMAPEAPEAAPEFEVFDEVVVWTEEQAREAARIVRNLPPPPDSAYPPGATPLDPLEETEA